MRILAVLIVLAVTSATAVAAAQAEVLRFGLLPHLSPQLLIRTYRPLVDYLEKRSGRPLKVTTAPDFKSYIERATAGRYDVYLTAPHIAALAVQRDGHRALGRFARQLHALVVVAADAPFINLNDLRGLRIATPDRLAVITLLGEAAFRAQGLAPDDDLSVVHMPSHNAALLAVVEGRADAAVAGVSAFDKMPAQVRGRLRIITRTAAVPHMIFMAGPDLQDAEVQAVRQYLLSFNATGDGADYFSGAGRPYTDLIEVSDDDLKALAPLVARLRERDSE